MIDVSINFEDTCHVVSSTGSDFRNANLLMSDLIEVGWLECCEILEGWKPCPKSS